jgi:uncharacterized protein (TIGR02145 family)
MAVVIKYFINKTKSVFLLVILCTFFLPCNSFSTRPKVFFSCTCEQERASDLYVPRYCRKVFHNITTHFCFDDIIYPLCNGKTYNPITQKCSEDGLAVLDSCGKVQFDTHSKYCSGNIVKDKEEFTDTRDNRKYKAVKIGSQIWMAENLNFNAPNSECYSYKNCSYSCQPKLHDFACARYGRLYNWATAMDACPAGWHLPSDEEWQILIDFAGGIGNAAEKLRTKSDWKDHRDPNTLKEVSGKGTDEFGFAALPGGEADGTGYSLDAGLNSSWWSSSSMEENGHGSGGYAYSRYMGDMKKNSWGSLKSSFKYVRCVKN